MFYNNNHLEALLTKFSTIFAKPRGLPITGDLQG
jgi:hypothetical protein